MSEENAKLFMEWKASEYVHHKKDVLWHVGFFMVSSLLAAGMYLILRDIISVLVVILMAVSLYVFAMRPPKTLRYAITDQGIEIGESKYAYESFRSFSVIDNGAVQSVVVDPMHRYLPPITIYFEPKDGQKIFDILSEQLPYVEYKPDIVDKLVEKIKF